MFKQNISKLDLSTEAKSIMKQGYGFRSDSISALDYQGEVSAVDSLRQEIFDCDNVAMLSDIANYCHLTLIAADKDPDDLTDEQIESDLKSVDNFLKKQFKKPIVLWLCANKANVIISYMDIGFEEFSDFNISTYKLPKNAILFTDFSSDGAGFFMDADDITVTGDSTAEFDQLSDDDLVELIDTDNIIFSKNQIKQIKSLHRPGVERYFATHELLHA